MSIRKPSAIAAAIVIVVGAVAGLASIGISQVAKPKVVQQGGDAAKEIAADKKAPAERKVTQAQKSDRNVHVEAPRTNLDVQKDAGKVHVQAPHTDVKVDPGKGQVRVRAPYVDLNIRW